jgi:soluble lytic murein transglycosylase-like protein
LGADGLSCSIVVRAPRAAVRIRPTTIHLQKWIAAGIALVLLALGLTVAARRTPLRRREAALRPGSAPAPGPASEISRLPIEQWTPRFIELERAGEWGTLATQLDALRDAHPDLYHASRLGYLHGRALLEAARLGDAATALEPFLVPGHPLRDLALHYRAQIVEEQGHDDEAARLREELVFQYPQATWRDGAITDLAVHIQAHGTVAQMEEFAKRLAPTVDAARRRDLEARRVEMLQTSGDAAPAVAFGIRLLKEELADDPAERVARALDHPELVKRMKPDEWMLLGESLRNHRHYDRAIEVLGKALDRLPARRDDLLFALGRAHFGAERYAEAEKLYLRGAAQARTDETRATFYYHASRAAQLLGDDTRAEQEMTQAIKAAGPGKPARKPARRPAKRAQMSRLPENLDARIVPVALVRRTPRARKPTRRRKSPPAARAGPPSPITSLSPGASALVQRLRTRLAQKRYAEAEADLRYAVQRFPREAAADATIAYGVALVAAGRSADALTALQAVAHPSDRYVASEVDYWQARAHEASAPAQALGEYLQVLRAPVPTHFAYFARRRVADATLAPRLAEELKPRVAEIERLLAAGDFDAAREVQTDVVLLGPATDRAREVEKLRGIYEKLPRYREVLELKPYDFPRFPLPTPPTPENAPAGTPTPGAEPQRLDLLLAMGLFDDAIDLVPVRWGLSPPAAALTRSLALHLGAAPRGSIYAAEVLMRSVPDDFVPELLPRTVRELLYPRYFYDRIVAEAKKHGADPRLVLSVMREESRFDPRAKSAAAARGLLQFIIATARDVGRTLGLVDVNSEDLYDPAIVIQLGAKYVADLSKQFEGDPYRTAAAYNAGPNQVKLWWRLSPEPRPDALFSSISFDETKNYVRKVLNSYERYGEIYEQSGPAGGLRLEP